MKIFNFLIHWARPDNIMRLVPLFIVIMLMLFYRFARERFVVRLLTGFSGKAKALERYSPIKSCFKAALLMLGLFFMGVALMRPQWDESTQAVAQEGRDVIIALDISRSMLAQDLVPDRLSYAKKKIKALIEALHSERVGLLLFSGTTFLQCPLTDDIAAFTMYLNTIDVDTIASGSTALEQPIKETIEIFKKLPTRKSKLLVVFTDGEDFSTDLTHIKDEAAALGLHIVTVGVGTEEGAPIPLYDRRGQQTGHQLDEKGSIVISRQNRGILNRLAEDTGGIFIPASQDESDIRAITAFINSFEKELLDERNMRQFQEQYHYPLIISFICLALEWLL